MTGKQIELLVREHLLPSRPVFDASKRLMYHRPVRWVLRGYHFDSTDYDKMEVDLQPLIQPVYIPTTDISFNVGLAREGANWERLRFASASDAEAIAKVEAYVDQSMAWSRQFEDPAAIGPALARVKYIKVDVRSLEAMAYDFVLAGDLRRASRAIDDLLEICHRQDEKPAMEEIAGRPIEVRDDLAAGPTVAVDRLRAWRSFTLDALGLAAEIGAEN